MKIELASDHRAFDLLEDPHFRAEWEALYQACPWATPFQSPEFVSTWYRTYGGRFSPVAVRGVGANGSLDGLLMLAVCTRSGRIEVAGSDRAEYQAWLSRSAACAQFITAALDQLAAVYPRRTVIFQYLPPGLATAWVSDHPKWSRRCRLEALKTPIMRVQEGADTSASRRRKTTRSLTKLRQRGAIQFERVTTVEEFDAVLDRIAAQYDFRQAAVNDYLHFQGNPLRRAFQLGLMRTPNLLHVTVLRHAGEIIAANIGLSGKGIVYLGIFSHAASYAKESPGKLHLVMLGDHLSETGYGTLDLTPGDDAYKPAFASSFEDVHRLTVFANPLACRAAAARHRVVDWVKRGLTACGVDPMELKEEMQRLRRAGLRRIVHTILWTTARLIWSRDEVRLYAMRAARVDEPRDAPDVRRDEHEDLLAFESLPGLSPRQQFLSRALTRIGNGHHVYTRVEGGTLIHHGWSAENQERAVLSEVGQEFKLPPRSAVLYDYYTHPTARGRGLYKRSLRQMMHDVASTGETDWIFIWVLGSNASSRHVIEGAGFEYRGSAFQHTVLSRVRRWSTIDAPPRNVEPPRRVHAPAGGSAL